MDTTMGSWTAVATFGAVGIAALVLVPQDVSARPRGSDANAVQVRCRNGTLKAIDPLKRTGAGHTITYTCEGDFSEEASSRLQCQSGFDLKMGRGVAPECVKVNRNVSCPSHVRTITKKETFCAEAGACIDLQGECECKRTAQRDVTYCVAPNGNEYQPRGGITIDPKGPSCSDGGTYDKRKNRCEGKKQGTSTKKPEVRELRRR